MEKNHRVLLQKITQRQTLPPHRWKKAQKMANLTNPLRSEEAQETRTLCICFHLKRLQDGLLGL